MKQGFLSPGLTHPFLRSTTTRTVDSTKKSNIYLIMNGLQRFKVRFAPQTIVCRGFNGTSSVPHPFQPSPKAGAPGTAAEGISVVLIGEFQFLEFTFPNPARAL